MRVAPEPSIYWEESDRAGYGGLSTCGSVWTCPVCASKVMNRRRDEVGTMLNRWTATGDHGVAFLTLTARHHKGQTLDDVWSAIIDAWGFTVRGGSWAGTKTSVGIKAKFGIEHWIRFVEVTHGKNGWHVHAHLALLTNRVLTEEEGAQLRAKLYGRWSKGLLRQGFSATEKHGIDVKVVGADAPAAIAKYLTKSGLDGLAFEVAHGQGKLAKKANRTPFQVLASIREALLDGQQPDREDLKVWRAWERGSAGRRQMGMSKGMRSELLPEVAELTDEEIVAEPPTTGFVVASITAEGWKGLVTAGKRYQVLEVVKTASTPEKAKELAAKALSELGIEHRSLLQAVETPTPEQRRASLIAVNAARAGAEAKLRVRKADARGRTARRRRSRQQLMLMQV